MKEQKISLMSAILLNMNILVGSAILFGSGRSAAVAGNASFLAWPFVALLFIPLVLCMAQLSRMLPGSGGFFAYTKEGLNIPAGFVSALLYVIGYTFAVVVEVVFIRQLMIGAFGDHWLLTNAVLFNALLVLVCMGLNSLSFHIFSKILSSLAITKIIPLAVLVALIPFIIDPAFALTQAEVMKIPDGLPFVIFGFWGFEYCCSLSHLIEDGERNASRATLIGFFATVTLYTLFHFGALNLMGAHNLATLGAPSYAEFITLPIPYLKAFLVFLIPIASILTIFATANGIMNSNVVMMYALAKERMFWKSSAVAKLSRFNRPWVAIVIQGIIVFIMATLLNIDMIGNLCNLATISSFLLPFISLLVLQHRKGLSRSLFLPIIAIVITLGFSVYSWYKLGDTMTDRMIGTGLFITIIAFGYALFAMRESRVNRFPNIDPDLDVENQPKMHN